MFLYNVDVISQIMLFILLIWGTILY